MGKGGAGQEKGADRGGKGSAGGKVFVRRPDAVVMRLQGVLVNEAWDGQQDAFAVHQVRGYLWDKRSEKVTQLLFQRLREDAALDRDCGDHDQDQVPQIPDVSEEAAVVDAAVAYMTWCVGREPHQHPLSPITLLKDSVCKEGMSAGRLSTPVFEEAVRAMRGWRFGQHFIKNYTLAVPDAQDQERLLTYTTCGDLRPIVANFIRLGQAQKALLSRTFRTVVAMIRSDPQDILFLTNSYKEADAAHAAGLTVLIVRRNAQSAPDSQQTRPYPVVRDFDHIAFINDPNRPAPCC